MNFTNKDFALENYSKYKQILDMTLRLIARFVSLLISLGAWRIRQEMSLKMKFQSIFSNKRAKNLTKPLP